GAGNTALLVPERDPANRISLLDFRSSPPLHRLVVLGTAFRPSSAVVAGRRLLVCTDQAVDAYDLTAGYPATVRFHMRGGARHVGCYGRVGVDSGGSGIAWNALDFMVPEGRRGGDVSLSRDATFQPAKPDIMLLAGYRPGTYRLRAIHRLTGAIVGEEK